LLRCQKSFEDDKQIIKDNLSNIDKDKPELVVQLLKAKTFCFNEESLSEWTKLVQEVFSKNYISDNPKLQKQHRNALAMIVGGYKEIELLPLWINVMMHEIKETGNAQEKMNMIIESYKSSFDAIKDLVKVKSELDAYDLNQSLSEPDKFETNLKKWDEFWQKRFSKVFVEKFMQSSNKIYKLYAIQIMNAFVDKFDKAIKTLKTALYKNDGDKVKNFHAILLSYLKLLKIWFEKLLDKEVQNQYNSVEKIKVLGHILQKKIPIEEDELFPSGFFNVLYFIFNEEIIYKEEPKTLEDCFTFIHQYLLIILGINTSKNIDTSILSKDLKKIKEETEKDMIIKSNIKSRINTFLISISFFENKILMLFNIPLRCHAMTIEYTYYNNDKTLLVIDWSLYGQEDFNRFVILLAFWNIISRLEKFKINLLKYKIAKNFLSIQNSLSLENNTSFFIHELIEQVITITYDFSLENFLDSLIFDINKYLEKIIPKFKIDNGILEQFVKENYSNSDSLSSLMSIEIAKYLAYKENKEYFDMAFRGMNVKAIPIHNENEDKTF
jgi:hypothetical protein